MKRNDIHELAIKQVHGTHMRTVAMIALKAICRSNAERPMTLSTSAVAVCCSRASTSSLVSRTTSASGPEAVGLLWRAAFCALLRPRGAVLRRRALACSLPALERRRIAHIPRLRSTPIFKGGLQQGFATGEMGFNRHFATQQP
jgi:hypothetical protein